MPDSKIVFYGVNWCWDCRRARRFLNKHKIDYAWVNIDKDKRGEAYVLEVNKGMRSVPTILFQDGSILVEPSNSELGQKLGVNPYAR